MTRFRCSALFNSSDDLKTHDAQEAKSIARHLGLTLRKVRTGDYRVNFRDGDETTAYYTDNLEDAVNSAVEMARKRDCERRERNLTSPEAETVRQA